MEKNKPEIHECLICFGIMVEPIKLSCSHVYCLECLDKIITNGDKRCPMDRKDFNFETDLIFEDNLYNENLKYHEEAFKTAAKKVINERYNRAGKVELELIYGNKHQQMKTSDQNRNKWTMFVKLKKVSEKKDAIFKKLRQLSNLNMIINNNSNINTNDLTNQDFSFNESEIINKVKFDLHPTFNPPSVIVSSSPFEIKRIGWGTFNIDVTVSFPKHLNLENLKLSHYLEFDNSIVSSSKLIHIDLKHFRQNK